MHTPVAMLVFNRPEHTARVFERVRAARPPVLFVVADGPRTGREDDERNCAAVRRVFDGVDWPCEVVRLFSETNLGCKQRVGSGITEVFRHVESAVFLEDDCLPEPSFFPYCEELLERYRDDERVMMISGDCFPPREVIEGAVRHGPSSRAIGSYHFTRFVHIWGWASWRRAWQHYDPSLTQWPGLRHGGGDGDGAPDVRTGLAGGRWLRDRFGGGLRGRADALFWTLWFQACWEGRMNTWDIPWAFSCWTAAVRGSEKWGGGGLAICPNVNLVTNIGFDGSGTHVGVGRGGEQRTRRRSRTPKFANLPTEPMKFPMRHPSEVQPCVEAEEWTQRHCFTGSLKTRWKRWRRYMREGLNAKA